MGKEIVGSSIMALAGFLLMMSIEGRMFDNLIRIGFLISSVLIFYLGMKVYHKYMPKESLSSDDWLIIIFSILTPFIVVSSLNSLGLTIGGLIIVFWLGLMILTIFKKEKIIDLLFPRFEEKPVNNEIEKLKKRYAMLTKKKGKRKKI